MLNYRFLMNHELRKKSEKKERDKLCNKAYFLLNKYLKNHKIVVKKNKVENDESFSKKLGLTGFPKISEKKILKKYFNITYKKPQKKQKETKIVEKEDDILENDVDEKKFTNFRSNVENNNIHNQNERDENEKYRTLKFFDKYSMKKKNKENGNAHNNSVTGAYTDLFHKMDNYLHFINCSRRLEQTKIKRKEQEQIENETLTEFRFDTFLKKKKHKKDKFTTLSCFDVFHLFTYTKEKKNHSSPSTKNIVIKPFCYDFFKYFKIKNKSFYIKAINFLNNYHEKKTKMAKTLTESKNHRPYADKDTLETEMEEKNIIDQMQHVDTANSLKYSNFNISLCEKFSALNNDSQNETKNFLDDHIFANGANVDNFKFLKYDTPCYSMGLNSYDAMQNSNNMITDCYNLTQPYFYSNMFTYPQLFPSTKYTLYDYTLENTFDTIHEKNMTRFMKNFENTNACTENIPSEITNYNTNVDEIYSGNNTNLFENDLLSTSSLTCTSIDNNGSTQRNSFLNKTIDENLTWDFSAENKEFFAKMKTIDTLVSEPQISQQEKEMENMQNAYQSHLNHKTNLSISSQIIHEEKQTKVDKGDIIKKKEKQELEEAEKKKEKEKINDLDKNLIKQKKIVEEMMTIIQKSIDRELTVTELKRIEQLEKNYKKIKEIDKRSTFLFSKVYWCNKGYFRLKWWIMNEKNQKIRKEKVFYVSHYGNKENARNQALMFAYDIMLKNGADPSKHISDASNNLYNDILNNMNNLLHNQENAQINDVAMKILEKLDVDKNKEKQKTENHCYGDILQNEQMHWQHQKKEVEAQIKKHYEKTTMINETNNEHNFTSLNKNRNMHFSEHLMEKENETKYKQSIDREKSYEINDLELKDIEIEKKNLSIQLHLQKSENELTNFQNIINNKIDSACLKTCFNDTTNTNRNMLKKSCSNLNNEQDEIITKKGISAEVNGNISSLSDSCKNSSVNTMYELTIPYKIKVDHLKKGPSTEVLKEICPDDKQINDFYSQNGITNTNRENFLIESIDVKNQRKKNSQYNCSNDRSQKTFFDSNTCFYQINTNKVVSCESDPKHCTSIDNNVSAIISFPKEINISNTNTITETDKTQLTTKNIISEKSSNANIILNNVCSHSGNNYHYDIGNIPNKMFCGDKIEKSDHTIHTTERNNEDNTKNSNFFVISNKNEMSNNAQKNVIAFDENSYLIEPSYKTMNVTEMHNEKDKFHSDNKRGYLYSNECFDILEQENVMLNKNDYKQSGKDVYGKTFINKNQYTNENIQNTINFLNNNSKYIYNDNTISTVTTDINVSHVNNLQEQQYINKSGNLSKISTQSLPPIFWEKPNQSPYINNILQKSFSNDNNNMCSQWAYLKNRQHSSNINACTISEKKKPFFMQRSVSLKLNEHKGNHVNFYSNANEWNSLDTNPMFNTNTADNNSWYKEKSNNILSDKTIESNILSDTPIQQDEVSTLYCKYETDFHINAKEPNYEIQSDDNNNNNLDSNMKSNLESNMDSNMNSNMNNNMDTTTTTTTNNNNNKGLYSSDVENGKKLKDCQILLNHNEINKEETNGKNELKEKKKRKKTYSSYSADMHEELRLLYEKAKQEKDNLVIVKRNESTYANKISEKERNNITVSQDFLENSLENNEREETSEIQNTSENKEKDFQNLEEKNEARENSSFKKIQENIYGNYSDMRLNPYMNNTMPLENNKYYKKFFPVGTNAFMQTDIIPTRQFENNSINVPSIIKKRNYLIEWYPGFDIPIGTHGRAVLRKALHQKRMKNVKRCDELLTANNLFPTSRSTFGDMKIKELYRAAYILGVWDVAEKYCLIACERNGYRKEWIYMLRKNGIKVTIQALKEIRNSHAINNKKFSTVKKKRGRKSQNSIENINMENKENIENGREIGSTDFSNESTSNNKSSESANTINGSKSINIFNTVHNFQHINVFPINSTLQTNIEGGNATMLSNPCINNKITNPCLHNFENIKEENYPSKPNYPFSLPVKNDFVLNTNGINLSYNYSFSESVSGSAVESVNGNTSNQCKNEKEIGECIIKNENVNGYNKQITNELVSKEMISPKQTKIQPQINANENRDDNFENDKVECSHYLPENINNEKLGMCLEISNKNAKNDNQILINQNFENKQFFSTSNSVLTNISNIKNISNNPYFEKSINKIFNFPDKQVNNSFTSNNANHNNQTAITTTNNNFNNNNFYNINFNNKIFNNINFNNCNFHNNVLSNNILNNIPLNNTYNANTIMNKSSDIFPIKLENKNTNLNDQFYITQNRR